MKHERLRKNQEFRNVYRRGKSFPSEVMVLYRMKNSNNRLEDGTLYNRVGISVSRKVGKSVVRSRAKRLIAEAVRLSRNEVETGFDFVFVARGPIVGRTFQDVQKNLRYLYKKAGLKKNEKDTDRID